jgi:glycosyltransferase involved in cell wall biosynthesis
VEIIVPITLKFPAGIRKADIPMAGDPPLYFLSLQGSNPRTYLFEGLIELLNEKKPAIILLDNDPVSRLAVVVGNWCIKNNSKLFCISCENLPLDILSTVKRKGWKSLPAAIVKRLLLMRSRKVVEGVFSLNHDGEKIFLDEGYKRVMHMPLGFDPEYFFPDNKKEGELKNKLGLRNSVIAYFGRLTREKGIHILINALQELKQYHWHLMMDSFDDYASDYSEEIKKMLITAGIKDRVVFINPDHFEIASFINAADIVVVPSVSTVNWKEQYGRVAAEAMACGKTVIASDSGSLPELLNGFGCLFPEGNIVALKQLLEKILSGHEINDHLSTENIAAYAKKNLSIDRQKEIMGKEFKFSLSARSMNQQHIHD